MNALRWYIAELLIGWALAIAPDDRTGDDLRSTILPWLDRQVIRLRRGRA